MVTKIPLITIPDFYNPNFIQKCRAKRAIDKNYNCEVFNLGNHKSEQLMDMIAMLEKELNQKAIIDFQPMQPGDVRESFADIGKSVEMLDFKPTTNIDVGINKFIELYIGKNSIG